MSEFINPSRRGLLAGLGFIACAPALIKVAALMPIKAARPLLIINRIGSGNTLLTIQEITREAVRLWASSNEFVKQMNSRYEQEKAFLSGSQWTPSQHQAILGALKIRLNN